MKALAKAVGDGALPSLQLLDLSNNQIGDEGITNLARALGSRALQFLTILDLGKNLIGDQSVIAFAKAAKAVGHYMTSRLSTFMITPVSPIRV